MKPLLSIWAALLLPASPCAAEQALPSLPSLPAATAVSTASAAKPPPLRLLAPQELPRFIDSFPSKKGLAKAARKSLKYLDALPPRTFRLAEREYGPGILAETLRELILLIEKNLPPEEFEAAVKEGFDVFQSAGSDGAGKVVFSSYYQPVLPAAFKRSEKYPYPLYRRPPDLVEVDPAEFDKRSPAGETTWVGRMNKEGRLVPYYTRDQIDSHKALSGRGLEIAWLKTKFDVLDLHIQGSGILRFPDGSERLAQFAATNARPYNSVGLALIKAGAMTKEEMSHDKLRQYFRDHPEAQDWALSQNPRYTFFKLLPLPEDGEPLGTIQESLVAARSIAVDPAFIPLGALAFFAAPSPQAGKDGALLGLLATSRFAVCMDTGGAIKGPGRVDIYAGHGPQAATTARHQWSEGRLYVLVKKLPPRER